MITEFSVSEARVADTCPRILYFDRERARQHPEGMKRVTRLWVESAGEVAGCGKLFHDAVEKFNRIASEHDDVRKALERAQPTKDAEARRTLLQTEFKRLINLECVNRKLLGAKPPQQVMAFVKAIDTYVREIAEIVSYALGQHRAIATILDELFGDTRKRVDVTVNVGPAGEPVRIRGSIDYIYFDQWRAQKRIIDYKLMPASSSSKDLMQVGMYAIMHHQQHQTTPGVAVLYLHPERSMAELTWDQVNDSRHMVYDLLASMAQWVTYDEQQHLGLKPPGVASACKGCPWNKECEQRLGPKSEGARLHHWGDAAARSILIDPLAERHDPPEPPEEVEYEDVEPGDEETPEPPPKPEPVVAPGKGMWLGATLGAGARPIELPVSVLPTHVAVMGAAGSGKTWLAKVVAEEAIRQRVPVLAIDPQGDLVQFLLAAELPPEATPAERELHAEFRRLVEPRIWTPGSSHAQRLSLSPIRLPRDSDLAGIADPQRRTEEWEAMLGVVAGNLVRLAAAGGDEELQATFMLEALRALVRMRDFQTRPLSLEDIASAVLAPDDIGIEDAEQFVSKTQREKLGRKLLARIKGPSSKLFTGGRPLDIPEMSQPSADGKVPLNVVYLNALTDDAQKQYFVAALAAEVYRWMITTESTGATRLLFYLDEAKDYVPAGGSKPPAKPPLLRLFAQGRKYGVSCLICTQSPRSVDYQIFSNASTKLIGRLEAAQDVERVAEWFSTSGGTPEWLAGRKGAAKGTFVGRWPDMPAELEGVEFRSRRLFSRHEGAWSPDRVEEETAREKTPQKAGAAR